MFIELKCRSCHQTFRLDFAKTEYTCNKCPKCGSTIHYSDVSRLQHLTESFASDASRTTSVDVCGIYAETTVATGTSIIASDLFYADLEQLNKLYSDASPEVKAKLAALMDKFYLLVNSDAKNSDLNRLETTLEQLNNLFLTKVQQKHSAMAQSLGIEL